MGSPFVFRIQERQEKPHFTMCDLFYSDLKRDMYLFDILRRNSQHSFPILFMCCQAKNSPREAAVNTQIRCMLQL